jgi:DNA-directed RNA polymerase subunit M/transcription elongation factor TFIIS
MTSPFCKKCGTLITTKKVGKDQKIVYWCPLCQKEVDSYDSTFFQEHTQIKHTPRDQTRILEDEPPPVPKIFTQTYEERQQRRCRHPNAVFQGFYQFSRGDEASRKYWYCPDCGQVFRFSGKIDVKPKRKTIKNESNKGLNEERGKEKK